VNETSEHDTAAPAAEPGDWDWRGAVLTSGQRRHAYLVLPGVCLALIIIAVIVGVAARAHGSVLWMPAVALATGSWAALIAWCDSESED